MAQYPLINGHRYGFSSVEISVNGTIVTGVSEISYSHKMEPGKVRGTSAQVMGRTRGQYEAEGSFTLYRQEADELRTSLGAGYLEKAFDITVSYADVGQPTVTDTLRGVRIKGENVDGKEGADASMVKFELDVIAILLNGISPITGLRA